MLEKTRLEWEIEHHERYRTSPLIRFLLFLLIMGLCAVGVYTFLLRQELSKKEQEIILMRENFHKEKTKLLDRIRFLEGKPLSESSLEKKE
jgi:hypothetical protein